MRILWPLINILQALYAMALTAVWVPIALAVSMVTRSRRAGLFLARHVWGPGCLRGGFARLTVEGSERFAAGGGPFFFVANHQSWMDVPALFAALPLPVLFVAKQELSRIPFLGRYVAAMGMVFIDRGHRQESARSVGQATDRLRRGWSVVSFPEGTRSRDGRVQRFKTATFAAAIEAGAPVVPVALDGPGKVLPPDGFRPRPGPIRVLFGEPIPTTGLDRSQRAALAERAQAEVETLLAGMRGER
jgi:1-acyl-sn-glycerol-3-phosphate acyltransferase